MGSVLGVELNVECWLLNVLPPLGHIGCYEEESPPAPFLNDFFKFFGNSRFMETCVFSPVSVGCRFAV
jgi:hypothetical protein